MNLRQSLLQSYNEVISKSNHVCVKCGGIIESLEFVRRSGVCPQCGHLQRVSAFERILMTADVLSFREFFSEMTSKNILDFPEYDSKLQKSIEKSGINEAIITGTCTIGQQKVAIAAMDPNFMMGSMGTMVGEKIVLFTEYARQKRLPLIIFCSSGGARMQEGMFSLMQMARCSVAIKRFNDAGLLYISVLTDPTTGGVSASFAMQSDITVAEPGALIGFAGRLVIEETIKQQLPEEFQTAEFLLEHGFIDAIIPRQEMSKQLGLLLDLHAKKTWAEAAPLDNSRLLPSPHRLGAWDRVRLVRSAPRPSGLEYISKIFDDFFELHGDRCFADDPAIVAGIAHFNGLPVTVIANQKGRQMQERMARNFGMPNPEGYRKTVKMMRQAQKFRRPLIFIVDILGAYPGVGAEERCQARAIADNLFELAAISVPVITLVVGEGGSGGALAMSVSDKIFMLENSIYSVITPEGCASILWHDAKFAPQASELLKLTAENLLEYGFIDRIIPEGENFNCESMDVVCKNIKFELYCSLRSLRRYSPRQLVKNRQKKFLRMTRSEYTNKSHSPAAAVTATVRFP